MSRNPSTLLELLRLRADEDGERLAAAFHHFEGSTETEEAVSYGELDRRSRALASVLANRVHPGRTALLMYPPGLDYLIAFAACQYAGVVGVPVSTPNPLQLDHTLPRVLAILRDSGAELLLSQSSVQPLLDAISHRHPELADRWVLSDLEEEVGSEEAWKDPGTTESATCFLQYTSGSTASPKGVVISHRALLANLRHLQERMSLAAKREVLVTWLPVFHDMGLIGNLLESLHLGGSIRLMSPTAFAARPIHWLELISRYGATMSGGPSFGFELCARKIPEEARAALDLSGWEIAFVGAEPVRAATLERFCEAFAVSGFRPEALYPCYGMAESCVIVTGGRRLGGAEVLRLDRSELEQRGRAAPASPGDPGAVALVGCGSAGDDHRLAIVDRESRRVCAPGEVGEIWFSGPSVAEGYWNRPESSAETFANPLDAAGERLSCLRTGDLGFVRDGEVFIAGRMKDVVIVRGRNLAPQDIEEVVDRAHPGIRPGCCAAFDHIDGDESRLVVVVEVRGPDVDTQAVVDAVRAEVAASLGIAVWDVLLIEPRSLPKTSSGKVQRHACSRAYGSGELASVERHRLGGSRSTGVDRDPNTLEST